MSSKVRAMFFPAYTRENERTHWGARNEERGTGQNDLKSERLCPFFETSYETFPFGASPALLSLPPLSSLTVNEEELRKLLPGCENIYV